MPGPGFEFEEPIYELQCKLHEYEEQPEKTPEVEDAIRRTRREIADLTEQIYANLSPWQTVQVARHKNRPHTVDYVSLAFDEFVELHGDKHFGDDSAIRTGFAKLDQHKVMVVGHEKGRTYKEKSACFFGCAHPEGYRKAMGKMRMAAKFGLPIVCLIDTPGAYPGIGAEERGQAQVIAENMYEMSRLGTPIICIVIGEGGSGGALGIGVGDRVAILQNSYYSVISPEGCAGIIWKSHEFASKAADALRFTSSHLKELGIVDDVISEPLGGAHRDPHRMASSVKMYLMKTLNELRSSPIDDLLQQRYDKFRRMGVFLEDTAELDVAE
ncbi:MAG: acetyl-CoA carboxylase carboxyltransferase subunit alpha [Planctomycetes bacterium]|nr:acetyl-CoA carboxylase carboxyltransferase subunit alpha [Planctomycetota bacterium]